MLCYQLNLKIPLVNLVYKCYKRTGIKKSWGLKLKKAKTEEKMISSPKKRSDREIFDLLDEKIRAEDYFFTPHAQFQCEERGIPENEILDILEGKSGTKRKRNRKKDLYEIGREDWNYCFEGINPDNLEIRIIITFYKNLIPIITVIDL